MSHQALRSLKLAQGLPHAPSVHPLILNYITRSRAASPPTPHAGARLPTASKPFSPHGGASAGFARAAALASLALCECLFNATWSGVTEQR
jgi:hypothetical protein